jgi:hypothetical protein
MCRWLPLDLLLLALSGLPAAAAHGGVPISFGSHPHFVRHFTTGVPER